MLSCGGGVRSCDHVGRVRGRSCDHVGRGNVSCVNPYIHTLITSQHDLVRSALSCLREDPSVVKALRGMLVGSYS